MKAVLSLTAIQEVRKKIAPHLCLTPVLESENLNSRFGARFFFKCENLQLGGAFKARGAFNAVFSLDETAARRGVATHSSGNHALALTLAARARGIAAYIVMPETSSRRKIEAVREAGAEITLCGANIEDREKAATETVIRTGAAFIHPYNDWQVIAGQGTAALEFLDQVPDLDDILVPVSGGGLLAGTTIAAKGISPNIRVIGIEPEGASDACDSFEQDRLIPVKNPQTIADGLRASLGSLPFSIMRSQVDGMVRVSEEAIRTATRQLWEELRVVVEPSSAVSWAAILNGTHPPQNRRIGIILTGGNVDLDQFPWT